MPASLAICVAGWHFDLAFYAQLQVFACADIYIISHRPASAIPEALYAHVPRQNVVFALNLGYDWGCYQQFLERIAWQEYPTICFMHDDVELRSTELFDRCRAGLDAGAGVIANGRVSPPQPWPRLAPHAYAHASWIADPGFVHDVVRGSFFMTTRAALMALEHFEVYWDPWRITSDFGNWSTRASCAKWEHRLGSGCFDFLTDEYLSSPYLVEHVRGNPNNLCPERLNHGKAQVVRLIEIASRRYVEIGWKDGAPSQITRRALAYLLKFFSGTGSASNSARSRSATHFMAQKR